MDSSSDGSFAWTDASDDTTDSEKMAKSSKNTSKSGDESESGITYKKKLQQGLFSDVHEHVDGTNSVDSPTRRKRKVSQVQLDSDSENNESPKKKRIKTESQSDVDVRKPEKKQKSSEAKNKKICNDSYDEDYLDSKVRDEQSFAIPPPVKIRKSKNKNLSEISDISLNNGDVLEPHDSSSCKITEKNYNNNSVEESSQIEEESSHVEEDENKRKKKKHDDRPNAVGSPARLKRKVSEIQLHSDSEKIGSPKKERIKIEPESDVDVQKVKKRHKSSEANNKNVSNSSYDEDYLDSKVRDEQSFAIPSPVKIRKIKNKNLSDVSDISLNNGDVLEPRESLHSEVTENSYDNTHINFEDESKQIEDESGHAEEDENRRKRKAKKSKRKRKKTESEASEKDISIRESFCEEETVVEERKEYQQNHHSTTLRDDVEKNPNGNVTRKDSLWDNSGSGPDKRHTRISERITFEDEEGSDIQASTKTPMKNMNNKKLKSFVESSISLKPFPAKFPNALVLTDNDDVWVIQCPKDVNIESFQDKNWTLESKCKIKLGDQTYEGTVADENKNLTIVSMENEMPIIKNLSIKGHVRLRRRIPKTHINENNIMVNNQYNFIPLPETKCRHPLFGLHYKKAMKLPSVIRDRLQAAHDHSSITNDKKKKKKNRSKEVKNEEVFSTPKVEHTDDTGTELATFSQSKSTSKKKKRKHSEAADEAQTPRKNKTKHKPDSIEAWESEKAIEENLFNF